MMFKNEKVHLNHRMDHQDSDNYLLLFRLSYKVHSTRMREK